MKKSNVNPVTELAAIGFAAVLGAPTEHDDTPEGSAEARQIDNRRVIQAIKEPPGKVIAKYESVPWIKRITWPDRVSSPVGLT